MVKLIYDPKGLVLPTEVGAKRKHVEFPLNDKEGLTRIGRNPANEVTLAHELTSRFHATIFRDNEKYYLLDHSLNGTFYELDKAGRISAEKRADSVLGTKIFLDFKDASIQTYHNGCPSHAEAWKEQNGQRVPRIVEYEPHKFAELEDIDYLLEMIKDPEQRQLLIPLAKEMKHETLLGVAPAYVFLFVDGD